MKNRKIIQKIGSVFKQYFPGFILIMTAVLTRFLPHPPNLTPVGGIALFSGAYLKGLKRFLLPLLIMFISDMALGLHNTILFVYLSFCLITFLGTFLKRKQRVDRIVILALSASLVFFLITNFGVWLVGSYYPKTIDGLLQAYVMGLPFLRNTMLGDLIYTPLLFVSYQLIVQLDQRLSIDLDSED